MLGKTTTIWLACLGLFIGYNAWLLTSPHRIRVSLVNVVEERQPAWLDGPPGDLAGRVSFEDPAILSAFDAPVALPPETAGPPSARAVQLLADFSTLASRAAGKPRCWNTESPQLIGATVQRADCRAFCPDYAILFVALAQKAGIPARRVVMEGPDGLGGGSHVVAELWLEDAGGWAMFDPYNFAYLVTAGGKHLSAGEARRLLLGGERAAVEVRQEPGAAQYTGGELLDYYSKRIADLQYPASNRLFTSHAESATRRAVSWAESVMAPYGPNALMLPRYVGRLLLKNTRYRVQDQYNGISYHPQLWFRVYRLALAALLVGLVAITALWLLRRAGATEQSQAYTRSAGA